MRGVAGPLCALALLAGMAALPWAQAQLPPEARMQVLILQADDAKRKGDNAAALKLFAEMDKLANVSRPAETYFEEAALSGQAQDYARAMKALEGYFRAASTSHPDYQKAVLMYATAEERKRDAEAVAAAQAALARAEAALAIAEAEALAARRAAEAQARAEAEAAELKARLEPLQAERAPVIDAAFAAARAGRPVSERAFRDVLVDGTEGPVMVALPAGSFLMGSPGDEGGRYPDEGPQRTVVIGYQIAVGRFEVTFAEWDACVAGGGCRGQPADNGWGQGGQPVIHVNWQDAQEYVTWLSGRTGRTYRLLSESEWEYAARAGTTTRWSFGDDERSLGSYAWFKGNSSSRAQPVGQKLANPFGLHDMHGNVWEWVEDCHVKSYSAGPPSDGGAFTPGNCSNRVFRGGAWGTSPQHLRSAFRLMNSPTVQFNDIGFRVARAF